MTSSVETSIGGRIMKGGEALLKLSSLLSAAFGAVMAVWPMLLGRPEAIGRTTVLQQAWVDATFVAIACLVLWLFIREFPKLWARIRLALLRRSMESLRHVDILSVASVLSVVVLAFGSYWLARARRFHYREIERVVAVSRLVAADELWIAGRVRDARRAIGSAPPAATGTWLAGTYLARIRALEVAARRSADLSRPLRDLRGDRWNSVSDPGNWFRAVEALRVDAQNADAQVFLRAALPVLESRIQQDSAIVCRNGPRGRGRRYWTLTRRDGDVLTAMFDAEKLGSKAECGSLLRDRWGIRRAVCVLHRAESDVIRRFEVPRADAAGEESEYDGYYVESNRDLWEALRPCD